MIAGSGLDGGAESGDATLFIPDSGVTNSMLANGAVTSDKLASEAAVKSLNALAGDVSLLGGNNVTITSSGNELTISATGGNGGGEQGPPGPQGEREIREIRGRQEKPLRYCPYGRLLTTLAQISSVGTKTTALALELLVPLSEEVEPDKTLTLPRLILAPWVEAWSTKPVEGPPPWVEARKTKPAGRAPPFDEHHRSAHQGSVRIASLEARLASLERRR